MNSHTIASVFVGGTLLLINVYSLIYLFIFKLCLNLQETIVRSHINISHVKFYKVLIYFYLEKMVVARFLTVNVFFPQSV